MPPPKGLGEGMADGTGLGVLRTLDAEGRLRGALRAPAFRAELDFPVIFLFRDAFRAVAFLFIPFPADRFRRGAFRLDFFLATVSPPLQICVFKPRSNTSQG